MNLIRSILLIFIHGIIVFAQNLENDADQRVNVCKYFQAFIITLTTFDKC